MTKRGAYQSKSLSAIVKNPQEREIIKQALDRYSLGIALPQILSGSPPDLGDWWDSWTSENTAGTSTSKDGANVSSGAAGTSSGVGSSTARTSTSKDGANVSSGAAGTSSGVGSSTARTSTSKDGANASSGTAGMSSGVGSSGKTDKNKDKSGHSFPNFKKKSTTTSISNPLKRDLIDASSTVAPKRPRLNAPDADTSHGTPMELDQGLGSDEGLCTHYLPLHYFVQS
jgi:hypothetical protein